MRRLLVLFALLLLGGPLSAQSFKISTKAPDLSDEAWLTERPTESKRITLVEFLHSNNEFSATRVEELRSLAVAYKDSLNVVVVIRHDDAEALRLLAENREYYYVIQTDAQFLRSIGVLYMPYAYVTCPNRRTVWCGNPMFLERQTLENLISDEEYYDKPLRKATSRRTRR